jgi:homoserine O-acetyltransferase
LTKATEVEKIAAAVPNATYHEISSPFGHDGFLLETKQLTQIIKQFLN